MFQTTNQFSDPAESNLISDIDCFMDLRCGPQAKGRSHLADSTHDLSTLDVRKSLLWMQKL